MAIEGEKSIEVEAPVAEVWAVLRDIDSYPEWQSGVKEVEVIERHEDGGPLVAETVQDAQVKTVRFRLRYEIDAPKRITWTYEKGDVKDFSGHWLLEKVSAKRTKVTLRLNVDPGRMLGMLLRGPVVDRVRDHSLGGTLKELKAHVER